MSLPCADCGGNQGVRERTTDPDSVGLASGQDVAGGSAPQASAGDTQCCSAGLWAGLQGPGRLYPHAWCPCPDSNNGLRSLSGGGCQVLS